MPNGQLNAPNPIDNQTQTQMSKANTWAYIKADPFFRDYLPRFKQHRKKICKKNGRGNPIDFSKADEKQIRAAIEKLFGDIKKSEL